MRKRKYSEQLSQKQTDAKGERSLAAIYPRVISASDGSATIPFDYSNSEHCELLKNVIGKSMVDGILRIEKEVFDTLVEEKTCPITCEKIVTPEMIKCGHVFEKDAITQWLQINKNCPVCRTKI